MPRMKIDAQFEREAASALRCLRDAEGVVRTSGHIDPKNVSYITVGRQWLEQLINERRATEGEIVDLERANASLRAEQISLHQIVDNVRAAHDAQLDKHNRIPRWVRRMFGAY